MSVKHLVIGTPAPYYKTKLFYVFKYKVSFRACLCSTHQVFVYIKHLENCLYQNVKNNQSINQSIHFHYCTNVSMQWINRILDPLESFIKIVFESFVYVFLFSDIIIKYFFKRCFYTFLIQNFA